MEASGASGGRGKAMTALLVTVLAASLVGSLHCVGMCGPFVAFYSGADGSSGVRRLLSHAGYSGGRLVAYLLLGLAAGAIGAALDLAGALAGVQRVAAVVAGIVMVAWGVIALLRIRGFGVFRHSSNSLLAGWSRRAFSRRSTRLSLSTNVCRLRTIHIGKIVKPKESSPPMD